ncbi:hypothetical protein M8J77_017148 [Diaphorina citri]|nr:hypothetical protein M8J77_017148 [Diaphorina citri]
MSRGRDRRSSNDDCKIYVGDLSTSSTKEDIEDAFSYYGPIKNVWVARNPPGFGFVEFEDRRDAEDAVRGFDGREINGRRVRVEMSNPQKMRGRMRARGRPFNPDDKCYECGGRGHYARDCRSRRSGGSGRRRRSYSRSRSRSYDRRSSRSRSRSGSKSSRSRSNSRAKEARNGK